MGSPDTTCIVAWGRTRRLGLSAALALHVLGVRAQAATLTDGFRGLLRGTLVPLADSFASAVGRSIPVIAASPGFEYEFDPETGTFTRRRNTGGQLFVEHADPLGKGHAVVGTYYLHVQFDELDGIPLRDMRDPFPTLSADGTPLFRFPKASVDTSAEEVFFSATYGVLSWLDVNVLVPFVYTRLRESAVIQLPGDEPLSRTERPSLHDTASGVGDLQLRGKGLVGSYGPVQAAVELALRIPTGSREDFQGTGDVEVTPMLVLSTNPWKPTPTVSMQAHVNLAMLVDVDDPSRRSEGRWAVGMDLGGSRVQLSVGLVGRDATGPTFSSREISDLTDVTSPVCLAVPLRRCLPTTPPSLRARHALFGLSSRRPDYVDGSIGIRAGLTDEITVVVGMLAPLLDEGLTTEPIPIAGLEAVF